MDMLIPGILLITGLAFMLIDLILIERRSLSETLITMQFFFPKKPLGIVGNVIVIISAIFLVLAFLSMV